MMSCFQCKAFMNIKKESVLCISRVAIIGQKFEPDADQEEPWYGSKYKLEKIPESVIEVSTHTSTHLAKHANCAMAINFIANPNITDKIYNSFNAS